MSVSRNMIVQEGKEKATFEFRLIAAPRPQITWFKDDVPLEETPRRRLSMVADVHLYSLTLDVEDVVSDDQGVYRIEAVNREGKAVANVKLDVTRKFFGSMFRFYASIICMCISIVLYFVIMGGKGV